MKLEFLHKEETNTRLILIATGWSTGAEIGCGIRYAGWDVAVIHDFSSLTLDTSFLSEYYTVYLFAWSFGVFASMQTLPADRITAAFAVNGTPFPIDDEKGIPEKIFSGTLDTLSSRNLQKFHLRMTGDRTSYDSFVASNSPSYDEVHVDSLRHQLETIRDEYVQTGNNSSLRTDFPWVRAFIASGDRIFPPENMRRAWEFFHETEIVEWEGAHYPDLPRIIRTAISDLNRVSQRFSKASSTYDTHAIAQYSAAIRLTELLKTKHPGKGGDILEIGCGTGLFTREYAHVLSPAKAVFVDITPVGPFGIAGDETYLQTDAEQWIATQPSERFDAILSASAIQWFANIPAFLKECERVLRPGGVLAISTFLPGNLDELDAVRPVPLMYPKAETLRATLGELFDEVKVIPDEIRVEFQSVRDTLMHLKLTGVGGSGIESRLPVSQLKHLRTLTYRPVYMAAVKKS